MRNILDPRSVLNAAILTSFLDSKSSRRPGELIQRLTKEQREALQGLTSEMTRTMHVRTCLLGNGNKGTP